MDSDQLDFKKIYDTYQPRILRYVTQLVGEDEAEDLTQEIFVKAHRALENFQGEASVSTWLYKIATNAATDRWRSLSFQRAASQSLPDDTLEPDMNEIVDQNVRAGEAKPSVEQQVFRDEMNACLREYLNKLPEHYRIVLLLKEMEGLRNKEIAEILGITLATVKIRLHRAKEKLKTELSQNCDWSWVEENEFLPDLKDAFVGSQKAGGLPKKK